MTLKQSFLFSQIYVSKTDLLDNDLFPIEKLGSQSKKLMPDSVNNNKICLDI